ncbi:MAG: hypothetical protein ISR40_00260 [Puniceicoccaceae bacterium]|nr:hypothetical protein [Puniceicoccaceae bacterium]
MVRFNAGDFARLAVEDDALEQFRFVRADAHTRADADPTALSADAST